MNAIQVTTLSNGRQIFYSDGTPDNADFTDYTIADGDQFYNCISEGGRADAIYNRLSGLWVAIA